MQISLLIFSILDILLVANKPGHAMTTDLDKYSEKKKKNVQEICFFLSFVVIQDKTYTVMMIDPDYPHHSAGQFYLHWLVTNIPVSSPSFFLKPKMAILIFAIRTHA